MNKKYLVPLLLVLLISCGQKDSSGESSSTSDTTPETMDPLKEVKLITPSGEEIDASLAYKSEDLQRGLSGVKPEEFDHDDGKFFFYFNEAIRTFWMPDTYFALDIFYLDNELKIEEIVRDLPAYQGDNDDEVPRAPPVRSRHVLEMKADSPVADKLEVGDEFQWKSSLSITETEEEMKENL